MMLCEKCGQPLAPDERFCGNCGAPVTAAPQQQPNVQQPQQTYPQPAQQTYQPVQQTYQPVQQPYQPEQQFYPPQPGAEQYAAQQAPQKPRKKVNKKRIAIIAGAVVACIGVFIAVGFATGLFKSWFKSDKDTVREVTTGTVHKVLGLYNNMVEEGVIEDLSALSIQIEPGEALKAVAQSKGVDLSWLNNITIDTSTNTDGGSISSGIRISVNDTEITTLNILADLAKGQLLMGADGLSDSIGSYRLNLGSAGLSSGISSEEFGKLLSSIDVNEIFELLEDYIDTALSALDEIEKSSGTITAAGVTGDCTVYTIKLSEKTLMNMEKKVLDKLVDDDRIKDLFEKIYPAIAPSMGTGGENFETVYETGMTNLKEMMKSFDQAYESASGDTMMTVVEYVKDDELVGAEFVSNASESFFFGFADGGDQFGVELSVAGKTYISGTGSKNGDVLNGTVSLMNNGQTVASVKLIDYDYKAGEGTLDIPFPSSALANSDMDAQTKQLLESVSLRIVKSGSTLSFDILSSNQSFIKVTTGKTAAKVTPLNTSLLTVDYQSWPSTFRIDTLKSRLLAAGMPSELVQKMGIMGSDTETGNQPVDEPDDILYGEDDLWGEDNVKLTVWAASAAVPLTKELCEEFIAKYPTKSISIDVKPMEEGDAPVMLLNDPAAAADVFSFASDQLVRLDDAYVLSSPAAFGYDDDVEARDSAASVEAATNNGLLCAYPETGENGYYLIYDKRVVSDADAKTLEGVLAACKKAGKKFIMDAGNGYYACMFMFTGGLALDGTDDGAQVFNDFDEEKVIDSLEAFNKLFNQYKGTFVSDNVDKILAGMSQSKTTVAAGIDGTWNAAKAKSILGDNYGAVKLPTIKIKGTDTQIISMNGCKLIGVNEYSEFPETAHLLARFLTDEAAQLKRAEEIAWSPSNKAVAASDIVAANKGTVACLDQANYSVPQVDIASTFWTPAGVLGSYISTDGAHTRDQIKKEFELHLSNMKDE